MLIFYCTRILLIGSGLNRLAGLPGFAIKFLTRTSKQFRRAVLPYHGQERLCNFHNLAQSFYSGAWTEQRNRRAEFKWAFWFMFFGRLHLFTLRHFLRPTFRAHVRKPRSRFPVCRPGRTL